MRDLGRISDTLRALERTWRKYPDLRLGQLLLNLTRDGEDLYNIEDEVLLKRLREYPHGGQDE